MHIGDMVYVEKGGVFIPKIVGVDKDARIMIGDKVKFITHCPECGSKLVRYEGAPDANPGQRQSDGG